MTEPLPAGQLQRVQLVDRPNRFLVRCRGGRGQLIRAFLPNPGRLWELLLPEALLYLRREPAARDGTGPARKTRYTAVAVERDGEPILLHTHWTNRVAQYLLERGRIPALADARPTAREVTVGRSRFDFLLDRRGQPVYLEVKSCTLYGNGVAMFPDAVTERGRRHLEHLAQLGRLGCRPCVLFLVHTQRASWFMPDFHTDLAFSQSLLRAREQVEVIAAAIQWRRGLELAPSVRLLPIPWDYLAGEAQDRGSYLLILPLKRRRRLAVGRLGTLRLPPGWYVYVGSAMGNLSARLARHTRLSKRFHWHIDYLRHVADGVVPLAIRSSRRQECQIAEALSALLPLGPAGFGASDCSCPGHLFFAQEDPLQQPAFHQLLQRFRMAHPASQ